MSGVLPNGKPLDGQPFNLDICNSTEATSCASQHLSNPLILRRYLKSEIAPLALSHTLIL